MMHFDHHSGHYLQVGDARIYFEQQGKRDGPALVLLHGGLGSMETFNAIAPHLGKTHRLIGIDSRGQGKSTLGSSALCYERLRQDVEAVLRHLALESVSIVGHSDGGIVGLCLAATHAIQINRLATIGAHWRLAAHDPAREMYAGITAADWRQMFPDEVERYQALNPEPDFEKLVEAVRQLWLDDGEDGYPNERVCRITTELLVIRGDEDSLVSRINAVELADRVKGAQLLNIPFADHSVHESRPEWLVPILDAFLLAG